MDPAEVARRFEDAGAAMITIHPRAAAEEYSGTADHAISASVVAAVDIPVVISGDIADAVQARAEIDRTGAAAVMIGRAALGNPWVFAAIAEGRPDPRPPLDEVITELEAFCDGIEALFGPDRSCHYLRKFHSWYLSGRGVPDEELRALMEEPDLAEVRVRLARLRERALLAA
jgi:tRNA-dihydrouridine synthase B